MIKAVIFDMYETLITHYNSPLYFSAEMAKDVNADYDKFVSIWRNTDHERTIGELSFEEVIEKILKKCNCYSKQNMEKIVTNRRLAKERCFKTMHNDIIPMLESLKGQGIKIGLISNCFSEEAEVIKESVLFPYFDVCILSCEHHTKKPERSIFEICLEELKTKADECIYIGDGGSNELWAAKQAGMKPMQATWYLKEDIEWQTKRMKEYAALEKPLDILKYLKCE